MRIDINPDAIARRRGMGADNAAQRFLADTVERIMNPYVPMAAGSGAHIKDRARIERDGSAIEYPGPYARFIYHGEVMVGASGSPWARRGERKTPAGRPLTYHGAPMRGPEWDKRMKADRMDEIVRAVATHVGGRPG